MRDSILAALREQYGEEKVELLVRYMERILEYNEHINLTAVTDPTEFLMKHMLDSLAAVSLPSFQKAKIVIDIGTGGGFPGVPLAVLAPEKEFVLLDSLKKRLHVIDELTEELGIRNVTTVHARVEDLGQDPNYRETFDLAVSRAVASLDILSEWCLPLVRKGGCFLSYKGEKAEEEAKEASKAIAVLGGEIRSFEAQELGVYPQEVSEAIGGHRLIVIRKVNPTPRKYPRKPGLAKKNPIR